MAMEYEREMGSAESTTDQAVHIYDFVKTEYCWAGWAGWVVTARQEGNQPACVSDGFR